MSKTFTATAALIGTIVGAGILGLPYVMMKSGYFLGLLYMVIIGIIITVTMLYLGEISLRTKVDHQLPGLANKYLGANGKKIMLAAMAFGIFSALLAYIIAEGQSLSFLLSNSADYAFILSIAFWLALSAITYFGIKALKEGETIGMIIILVTIISISVYFSNKISISNLTEMMAGSALAPIGVILFSFLGFSAIPEVERILGAEKGKMKKVIITSYAVVFLLYALFAAVVIGFKGSLTPEIATIALGKPFILLGMLTMFGAYLALSIAMIDAFRFDYGKTHKQAWLYVTLASLALFLVVSLIKSLTFTKILGIGGAISGAATGILILMMIKRAKHEGDDHAKYSMPYSKTIGAILIAAFIAAVVIEIINLF